MDRGISLLYIFIVTFVYTLSCALSILLVTRLDCTHSRYSPLKGRGIVVMFGIEFHIDLHQIEDAMTNVGDIVNVISHDQVVMANPIVLGTWSLAYHMVYIFNYLSIKTPQLDVFRKIVMRAEMACSKKRRRRRRSYLLGMCALTMEEQGSKVM